jgi:uncharacterized protein YjbI with pentapeptide repeats
MKLAAPRLPAHLEVSSITTMVNDGELEAVRLEDEDAVNCNVAALDLSEVVIDKVQLTGAHFGRVTMRDVSLRSTDLSSAHLENGMLVRTEFVNCRMTGVDFSQTSLHDVTFRGCKLDLANFRQADLRRVHMIDCTLLETDFTNATLSSVEFQASVLDRTVFTHATCKLADLRSSQLIDVVGWRFLKGVTIDSVQLAGIAPSLAAELGLRVRST